MFILETPNGFYMGEDGHWAFEKETAKRFATLDELPECVSAQDRRAFAVRNEAPDYWYIVQVD